MTNPSDGSLAQLAAAQYGVFTGDQSRALGFSEGARHVRVATGRWVVLYDGVYRIGGAPSTWHGELLAACLAAGSDAVASHRSAAALWALPSQRHEMLELTCPRWKRTRHHGLVVHETMTFDELDQATVDGIPCTTAARTLFDLARRLSPVMLDANVDAALRRGLVNVDELVRTVDRLATKGRPGGRRFREVVGRRTDGGPTPESVPERLIAELLVKQGLGVPDLQFEIRHADGRLAARVDLAYPAQRIAIEYDSFEHHLGRIALVRDSARRNALAELGFTVLTATAADVRDGARRLASAVRRIRERAA